MMPLVSIPAVVVHYTSHFRSVFTDTDFDHFQRYLSGLIVSENKTIEGMNRLFVLEVKNQSTLNRFLSASTYDLTELNKARLSLVADFVKQLQEEHHNSINKKNTPVFGKVSIKYKGKKEVYYNYYKTHHICGYGRQKLLISFSKSDLSDTTRVFISNRLKWRAHQLTRVGRHRWAVEEYHKEGKAEGLDKYQTRNFEAIKKHVALVAVVYSILQGARYDDALLNQLQAQLKLE
ncbi:MAG: hypothetical protein AAF599_06215, partial [Bacteroidota bacterium]